MTQRYYVAVLRHDKHIGKDGSVSWTETEVQQYSRPMDGKYSADSLNEKHRTPDRFYSARMVWLD